MVPNARHRCNSHSVPDDSGGGRGLMGAGGGGGAARGVMDRLLRLEGLRRFTREREKRIEGVRESSGGRLK